MLYKWRSLQHIIVFCYIKKQTNKQTKIKTNNKNKPKQTTTTTTTTKTKQKQKQIKQTNKKTQFHAFVWSQGNT